MTRFFNKRKKLDPYTEAVANVFNKVNKKITPSEVAEYLKIHPNTAKNRIFRLEKGGYVRCEKEGKKLFCSRRKQFKF